MKKFFLSALIILGTAGLAVSIFAPTSAHAAGLGDAAKFIYEGASSLLSGKWIIQLLGNLILSLFGWILWLAGVLLNFTMDKTVLHLKDTLGGINAIREGWIVVRDVANIFFIFILLYIAITKIIGLESGDIKKLLPRLIVAALLINFSLFFTRVLIDASNITALHFYKSFPSVGGGVWGSSTDPGFSDTIMSSLKLETIYNIKATNNTGQSAGVISNTAALAVGPLQDTGIYMISTIMGSVFVAITAFIFFAAAILLIVRFVILVLLMTTAPAAFAAMILPGLSKISSKWWGELRSQLIWVPAYMLLMWVSLRILPNIQTISGVSAANGAGFGAVLAGGGKATVSIVFNFLIVNGFMIGSLIAAKSIGTTGSATVADWGKSARKWGQGVAGRNTMGRAGANLEKRLSESKFGNSRPMFALRKLTTGALAGAKFGSGESRKDVLKQLKADKTERAANVRQIDFMNDIKGGIAMPGVPPLPGHYTIPQVLNRMSDKEIEKIDSDDLMHPEVLQQLDQKTLDYIVDKSERSDEDKTKIKQAHLDLINKVTNTAAPGYNAATAGPVAQNMIRKASGEYLAKLPSNMFTRELVANLVPSQLAKMDSLPPQVRTQIGTLIRTFPTHACTNFILRGAGQGVW